MTFYRALRLLFLCLAVLVVFVFVGMPWSYADAPDNRPPDNRPPDRPTGGPIDVQIEANSSADALSSAVSNASSTANATGGSATAEGGASSVTVNIGGDGENGAGSLVNDTSTNTFEGGDTNFNSESSNTNVVLVPNNNTAGCMRVYGLSFGNGDGAGGLGLPFRDESCDYEQAADDAAASGEHDIAWWWRCHKKNLYKAYRNRGESAEKAVQDCYVEMKSMLGFEDTAVMIDTARADFQIMAELTDEEADELREKIEELEKELQEREQLIQEQQQQQRELQQQQNEYIDQDAIRRQRAREILQKQEA